MKKNIGIYICSILILIISLILISNLSPKKEYVLDSNTNLLIAYNNETTTINTINEEEIVEETTTQTTTTKQVVTTTKEPNITDLNKDIASSLASPNQAFANDVLIYTNNYRSMHGLPPLTLDSTLSYVASIRAYELHMAWSHTRPDGRKSITVYYDLGVIGRRSIVGENLGYGQRSASEVVDDWYNSKTHQDNLLKEEFTKMGIALVYVDGIPYWAQTFSD